WTTQSSTPDGDIRVTTAHGPNTGAYHVTMAKYKVVGYNTNELKLHLDLAGEEALMLNFSWKDINDEPDTQDGVYISDDAGVNYTKIFSFTGNVSTYQDVSLMLSDLIDANGLTHSSNFIIKFQQYDNYPLTTDGIAIDDICCSKFLTQIHHRKED
ncbi:MAG: hypothetical protein AAFR59_05670, partial [Bacteroidota bacterium]